MIKKILLGLMGAGLLVNLVFAENENTKRELGGAGYFEVGLISLDIDAVKESVKEFEGKKFDFDDNTFVSFALAGYVGEKSNGMRIGLGVWGGYKATFSDEWRTAADSLNYGEYGNVFVDSVIKLHMGFIHSGLLVEKSFKLKSNFNTFIGGTFGGGGLLALAEFREADNAFRDIDSDDDDYEEDYDVQDDDENMKLAMASYWALDVHGGVTYTLSRWMHVGLEAYALMQYSSSGFGNRTGTFINVCPGARLRIVFGTSV